MIATAADWPDDDPFRAWLERIANGAAPVLDEAVVRRIQKALNRLAPEHKIVLVLKDLEALKYDAIASVLQIPVGTVRSRICEARLRLRELLQGDDGDQR
ncbi:MAG: hypothetical protein JNM56_20100 [Planctomycetia bacterium]|nr:hypothetical protein [Planctomycetia bacterium]